MEPAYISAIAGLTGAAIGGMTSFASNWFTQHTQLHDKYRQERWSKREQLFSAFIVEASRLYGDALTHENDSAANLVRLYAMVGRMRLVASRDVLASAERTMDVIVQTYLEPNRTLQELRHLAGSGEMNFLADFSEASRKELEQLAPVLSRFGNHLRDR